MATSDAPREAPSRSRQIGREDLMRREVLAEWRGADEVVELEAGIHVAGSFIRAILRAAGLEDGLREDELRSTWREIAGDFISRHTEPLSAKGGHVVLRVTQPAMRFHLEQMKPMLLARIRSRFGEDRIVSINFTLG